MDTINEFTEKDHMQKENLAENFVHCVTRTQIVSIFVIAFLVLLPVSLMNISTFDEGFIVTGADLIRFGKVPYVDFISNYGPAQYYLIAFLYTVFGPDLLVSRLAHVFTLGCLVALVFSLSAKISGGINREMPYITAFLCTCFILIARPNANYPALAATVFLLGATYYCSRGLPSLSTRHLIFASSLIAVAGLFRWDFGIYGVVALGFTVLLVLFWNRQPRARWYLAMAASFLPAGLISALIYVPLLIRSNADRIRRYSTGGRACDPERQAGPAGAP